MFKPYLLCWLCCLFMANALQAQQAKPFFFAHYGVNNGLAAYNTAGIVQDEAGYIWIGTINGLQRLDGHRFITFRHVRNDIHSLPDNNVEHIHLDKQKNLWVVLNDGSIGRFDTKRFVFIKAKVKLSNPNNLQSLRKLSEDSEGNMLYTFFNTEVLTYNPASNEFAAAYNKFNIPLNWKPVAITDDPHTKKYWIGTDSGMVVFNRKTGNSSYRGHNVEQEPLVEELGHVTGIGCYRIDSKHRLWFLSWPVNVGGSRLYCYDLTRNVTVLNAYDLVPIAKNYIEPDYLLEQQDGTIWISGLKIWARFSEETRSFVSVNSDFSTDESMNYDRLKLFEDREKNLWVATNNNGVFVFNPARQMFKSIKHINRLNKQKGSGYLISFLQVDNGSILVGAWGDGLYRYDSSFNNINLAIGGLDEANGMSVWGMCRSRDNHTIWLVGQQGFILVYDLITNTITRYDPAIFEAKTIRQVVEDRNGIIWLGTQSRGVFKWDPAKATQKFEDGFSRFIPIPNVRVNKMIVDSKGFIWACTNKEGVYKIDPATNQVVDHLSTQNANPKRILTNNVSSILEYNDSTLIIASGALNIYHTSRQAISYITSADGLPSDAVMSVEKDRKGYVWLGLMNGLCRLNLQKRTTSFFDRSDGLANDNFQVAASYTLPDGRMMFGSSDDFVVFDPNEVKTGTVPPDVAITDFKLLNRSLLVDSLLNLERVELTANQNSVTISFAALSFFNSGKLQYYYMLEGIDKEWKKANELNQAIYNYLPAGTFNFKVRAENADGISSKNISSFQIKVYPPFWKSWWFIGLLVIVITVIIYVIDRLQFKRKEGIHKMRNDIAGNLHEEVNKALNNINILSEMARLKADNEPVKSKEYIEQIHSKSHNMIISMDDMLWSLSPENDSMPKTVERMREFVDALQNRHGVIIEIAVDKKVESMELNMKLRHEAFLLFKSIIRCLVQAGSKTCSIHIGPEKSNLLISMEFDSIHCDMQQINNFLQNADVVRRRQLINATLDVEVHKTNAVLILLIPV